MRLLESWAISYSASEMDAASHPAARPRRTQAISPLDGAPGLAERARLGISAVGAALLGLAPHVVHHAGPLAGAALFAGVGGSLLFGALGFLVAIPFLVHLHRRHESWRVPAAALALMVAVFSLSTFVIGPAISGSDESNAAPGGQAVPVSPAQESAHEAHH